MLVISVPVPGVSTLFSPSSWTVKDKLAGALSRYLAARFVFEIWF